MNIWKGMIFGGPVIGIVTLVLSIVLPNYYQSGIGFFGLIAGLMPVVGYFMYRRVVPTAFTYADAKLEGKRILWVFSEDKTATPVHTTFDSGKLLVGDTSVIIDSPEDTYLLDGVPTAIMYRPIGKTLDPKKLFFIRELEHLGYDKDSFKEEMEKQAFISAFKEKYAELIKAGYPKEQAKQEALAYAQKEMTNYNRMPNEMKIKISPDGKREVVKSDDMSDDKSFVITINPAVAYRWISNVNSYKQSEMLAKERYKVLKQFGRKRDFGDIMKWVIAFAAILIVGYIAIQLFTGHSGSETPQIAQVGENLIKNATVVRT